MHIGRCTAIRGISSSTLCSADVTQMSICLVNKANLLHNFLSMFISFLYVFWATMCPSSGEITVSMQHLVFVTLWMTAWYAGCTLDTRQSSTQSDKYQVSHRYSYFSWWWAHSCPKHVEKRNILRKLCTKFTLFTRLYRMHSQQNIKSIHLFIFCW